MAEKPIVFVAKKDDPIKKNCIDGFEEEMDKMEMIDYSGKNLSIDEIMKGFESL